jgi:hypothetical protein
MTFYVIFAPYSTKIDQKMGHRLKCNKAIKLLKDYIEIKLHDLRLSIFLRYDFKIS